MIRNIIILALVLFSISAEAQLVNRRQRVVERPPGPTGQSQKLPEFNPKRAVGISTYDMEKVSKKLKLKKKSESYKKVATILNSFHKEINQIARINSFTFTQAKEQITISQKATLETRDYSTLQEAYKEVSKKFEPIVKQVEEKEKNLDEQLKKVLSEKQFKKWKKYKLKVKRKGK